MGIICIQGGSYDPVTEAHLAGAQEAGEAIGADRNILLHSQNPLKNQTKKAPLEDRKEMTRIRLSFHPEYNFEITDEENIGSHYTWDVLTELQRRNPGDQLVWAMGLDNLADFENWQHKEELLETFPFFVLQREIPPDKQAAVEKFKLTYAHLRRDSVAEMLEKGGWYLTDNAARPDSSTKFRDAIKAGARFSNPADQAISDYAWEHLRDVYGLVLPDDRPKPQFPGLGPA